MEEEAYDNSGNRIEVIDDTVDAEDIEQEEDLDGGYEQDENQMEDGEGNDIVFEDDSIQGFFEHREPVFSVEINPVHTNIVATGGGDDNAYLWDLTNGEALYKLGGHTDSVITTSFNFDGSLVATGGMDGKIQVFKVSNGELACQLEGPDEVIWIKFHPAGNVLLAGSNDGTLWLFKVPSGVVMNVFVNHTAPVSCGTFTNNGKLILSASEDTSLVKWDPVSAKVIHKLDGADGRFHQEIVTCLAINSDDTLALTGSADSTAKLIRLADFQSKILSSFQDHSESVEAVGFSNGLPFCATGGVDGKINVYDVTTLRLRLTLSHDDSIIKLIWSKVHAHLLFSCSVDQTVKVWDVRTGENVKTFKGHQDSVLDFATNKDGIVVTGSDDGNALVFKI